jgi:hypothetical protein
MHIIPTLARANKVVNALGLRTNARLLLLGWFREDGLRGRKLNMVLTITIQCALILWSTQQNFARF